MPSRHSIAGLVLGLALCWAPSAAAQEPTEEEMQQILEALRDTVEARGEARDEAAPRDTLGGAIPQADPLYNQLLQGSAADTLAAGQGPIVYRGQRLVFYPESEVIVLEGQASAEQAGTGLEANRILYRPREGIVEAFGAATVSRGPSELGADSLFYDRGTGVVATFGASLLREGQSQTQGFDLRYDLERRSGLLGAGTTVHSPWILVGDQMNKVGDRTFLVSEGHFTTCELGDPHYRFVSDEIKLRREDVIVASPVILYFSDIPVFFLPWHVEPVVSGRHSGFLRPRIGINTLLFASGRERNIQDLGYYYAFGDYGDATLAADWYTESRFIVRFGTRYHLRYSFRGDAGVEQVWNRLDDSTSRLIRLGHDQELGQDSRLTADVNWSNSRSYLRRNSFDPQEILQRSFRSAASYSTRFDWGALVAGSDADFRLDVNRTDYRPADIRLSINSRPLWGARQLVRGEPTERPWWQSLQYSGNAQGVFRISRSQVDSLGNPLTSIPVDSLGRPIPGDIQTITNQQEGRFNFTLSGPLNLGGIFNTTPSLAYAATVLNDRLAEGEKLGGQGRLNAALNMSSRFFRIFRRPIGPLLAMRHTVAPVVGVTYAPKPTFWGGASQETTNLRESFFINLSLTQDWDVKLPIREDDLEGQEAPADTFAPADTLAPADTTAGVAEEPGGEELEEEPAGEGPAETPTRTVNLLNITNSLGYDVTRAREPDQIGFSDLITRVTSGLGESFNFSTSFNHNLVDRDVEGRESFSPFLSSITTDFSMSRGGGRIVSRQEEFLDEDVLAGRGAEDQVEEARETLASPELDQTGFGPWSINLTHSWSRLREGEGNRQSMSIGARLLPTPAWSLSYQTSYDITDTQFQGQTLSLVRELHDWTASLNVNFFPSEPQDRVLVSFSVHLTEAPDLQIPYRVRRE